MFVKAGAAVLALLGALPVTFACEAHTGGVPVATSTKQLSEPIYVKAGEVYDGGWAKFDRSPSSCSDQGEGGMCHMLALDRALKSDQDTR